MICNVVDYSTSPLRAMRSAPCELIDSSGIKILNRLMPACLAASVSRCPSNAQRFLPRSAFAPFRVRLMPGRDRVHCCRGPAERGARRSDAARTQRQSHRLQRFEIMLHIKSRVERPKFELSQQVAGQSTAAAPTYRARPAPPMAGAQQCPVPRCRRRVTRR